MLLSLINKLVFIFYGLTCEIRYAPKLQRINRGAWYIDKAEIKVFGCHKIVGRQKKSMSSQIRLVLPLRRANAEKPKEPVFRQR